MTIDEFAVQYHRRKRWFDKFRALAASVAHEPKHNNLRRYRILNLWADQYRSFMIFQLEKNEDGYYLAGLATDAGLIQVDAAYEKVREDQLRELARQLYGLARLANWIQQTTSKPIAYAQNVRLYNRVLAIQAEILRLSTTAIPKYQKGTA